MKDIEELIQENRQFILRCASKCSGKFITESDDEWSVALLAFTEAAEAYDESKGSFHSFAAMVIRRRIIDEMRRGQKYGEEIPVEPWGMDGSVDDESVNAGIQGELLRKSAEAETPSAGDEIEAANEVLRSYGFSFFDLTECSPKARKTKQACTELVAMLLKSPELMDKLKRTKQLPVKELELGSRVSRKIIDRHRKYIIAAAVILSGEYPVLAEYLDSIRKALNG
ncbi:MAG: RNA polymerase subunit sigma [Eubacteriaceae bacterium]|nr:RNA polymerase subunit sigma [Eubacteriaceae bacterium]